MDHALENLNLLSPDAAREEFLKCCGSNNWALHMAGARPFKTVAELLNQADSLWWSLAADDWLTAFRSHPKIGEQKAANKISLTLILKRDDKDAGLYHVVGCTKRTPVGFFDDDKKNEADGISQKELRFVEPKK